MPDIIIYHNGECSKSKGALELLLERGIPHIVRWYLAEPLTPSELMQLLGKLRMQPSQLIRKHEALYLARYQDKEIPETEWFTILIENPILLERPIVEYGHNAVVARPAERMFEIIPTEPSVGGENGLS